MGSAQRDEPQKSVCASGCKLQSPVSAFVHPSAQFLPQLPRPSVAARDVDTFHCASSNWPSVAPAIPPNAAASQLSPPAARACTTQFPQQESAVCPACAYPLKPPAPDRDSLPLSPPPKHPAHQSSDERRLAAPPHLAWRFRYSHRDKAASNR